VLATNPRTGGESSWQSGAKQIAVPAVLALMRGNGEGGEHLAARVPNSSEMMSEDAKFALGF
jgi:hypothetical protein